MTTIEQGGVCCRPKAHVPASCRAIRPTAAAAREVWCGAGHGGDHGGEGCVFERRPGAYRGECVHGLVYGEAPLARNRNGGDRTCTCPSPALAQPHAERCAADAQPSCQSLLFAARSRVDLRREPPGLPASPLDALPEAPALKKLAAGFIKSLKANEGTVQFAILALLAALADKYGNKLALLPCAKGSALNDDTVLHALLGPTAAACTKSSTIADTARSTAATLDHSRARDPRHHPRRHPRRRWRPRAAASTSRRRSRSGSREEW